MKISNTELVKEFEYDQNKKELTVTFRNNKKYTHSGVSESVVNGLEMSKSMDEYYESKIKNQFESTKSGEADQLLFS